MRELKDPDYCLKFPFMGFKKRNSLAAEGGSVF